MLFLPRPEIVRSVLKTKLYLFSRHDDDDAQKPEISGAKGF